MKETRFSVSLTRDEVVEKLRCVLSTKKWENLELITHDRQFAHIRTKTSASDVLFRKKNLDPLFIDLHLKESVETTQLIITPSTTGYLLAIKIFVLPALWIIVPVLAVHQEGWGILQKLIPIIVLIQLILWGLNRYYLYQTRKIMNLLVQTFKPFESKV